MNECLGKEQGPGLGTQTRGETLIDKNVQSANKEKLFNSIKKGWSILSSYLIVGLVTSLIGVAIGVKVSKKFYHDKMVDCTLSQGLVFESKPYTLMPK